jgi:hypothetical protein
LASGSIELALFRLSQRSPFALSSYSGCVTDSGSFRRRRKRFLSKPKRLVRFGSGKRSLRALAEGQERVGQFQVGSASGKQLHRAAAGL